MTSFISVSKREPRDSLHCLYWPLYFPVSIRAVLEDTDTQVSHTQTEKKTHLHTKNYNFNVKFSFLVITSLNCVIS